MRCFVLAAGAVVLVSAYAQGSGDPWRRAELIVSLKKKGVALPWLDQPRRAAREHLRQKLNRRLARFGRELARPVHFEVESLGQRAIDGRPFREVDLVMTEAGYALFGKRLVEARGTRTPLQFEHAVFPATELRLRELGLTPDAMDRSLDQAMSLWQVNAQVAAGRFYDSQTGREVELPPP
jgi:hypothetical protein